MVAIWVYCNSWIADSGSADHSTSLSHIIWFRQYCGLPRLYFTRRSLGAYDLSFSRTRHLVETGGKIFSALNVILYFFYCINRTQLHSCALLRSSLTRQRVNIAGKMFHTVIFSVEQDTQRGSPCGPGSQRASRNTLFPLNTPFSLCNTPKHDICREYLVVY